ncbi:hypothetical protein [Fluviicola taffensis]|uniref:TonB C-terminal domain-containing protein n=1 Tax=Fluviicola taffensis (strain DSM 16823 / NCIMB 13979 / RW262) TaxID=755732 RepID=F2IEI6_FLUTR|nr:hypothetical protein [Fluviicola taffensis]AEA44525.1 hypothetical protein Fluta_2540 [Fluviicola taffensis DSM 16823]
MKVSLESEKTYEVKDRKVAGIISASAFLVLLTILCFIGYRFSNPIIPKQALYDELTLIPLDPQLLQQGLGGSQSGTPAKVKATETTPLQVEQILTQQSSNSSVKLGSSSITNTTTPNNNPASAQHTSDNPFATGGINDGNYRGNSTDAIRDNQNDNPKTEEKVKRNLVSFPNTHTIQSNDNCKIVLSVLVDPNGNIVENPTLIKGNSTTNDVSLINQVISAVKNQAQFNTVNTTKNTKEVITIRITAN